MTVPIVATCHLFLYHGIPLAAVRTTPQPLDALVTTDLAIKCSSYAFCFQLWLRVVVFLIIITPRLCKKVIFFVNVPYHCPSSGALPPQVSSTAS